MSVYVPGSPANFPVEPRFTQIASSARSSTESSMGTPSTMPRCSSTRSTRSRTSNLYVGKRSSILSMRGSTVSRRCSTMEPVASLQRSDTVAIGLEIEEKQSLQKQRIAQGGSEKGDSTAIFTKEAFSAYVTGQNTSEPRQIRFHLLYRWRRAPMINHNYDAVGEPLILSPDSKTMMVWESLIINATIWTMLVAPLEIANVHIWQWVIIMDWIVTLLYVLDIPLRLFVAIENRGTSGVRMVFDRDIIISRYLTSIWLLWDILCALPVDLLQSTGPRTQILKMIRLMRLIKLQRAYLLKRVDMPYTALTVVKCVVLTGVCTHWFACVWAALPHMQTGTATWIDYVTQTKLDLEKEDGLRPATIYMWSLYYSISLITTVGFGDVTPQTDLECGVCTCGIVVGSVLWAYILSSLLDVLNRLNPHRTDFEQTMDELNRMMYDHNLPDALRNDVRHYFHECQDLWKMQSRSDLIDRMSRSLKGRVTLALNGEWVEKVIYIRSLFIKGIPGSTAFVVELARKMVPKIFSPGEHLASPALYIVRKGIIVAGFRLLGVGDVSGDDILMDNPKNRSPFVLISLTMSATLALARASFVATLEKFPAQRDAIRQYTLWLALRRGLARELRIMAGEDEVKRTHTSFLKSISQSSHSVDASMRLKGDDDEDMAQEVATVADLNSAIQNMETLMAKQHAIVTELINQNVINQAPKASSTYGSYARSGGSSTLGSKSTQRGSAVSNFSKVPSSGSYQSPEVGGQLSSITSRSNTEDWPDKAGTSGCCASPRNWLAPRSHSR